MTSPISGTVTAALEAVIKGTPGIAVSLGSKKPPRTAGLWTRSDNRDPKREGRSLLANEGFQKYLNRDDRYYVELMLLD